ncbi:DUF6299 family protein [Streptomyces sp. BI20]|uniref:DUF6299 family protein n=1 Tax=Streptomyces sp. BI20 TaxID=3403460 RepID=UPI003C74AFBC
MRISRRALSMAAVSVLASAAVLAAPAGAGAAASEVDVAPVAVIGPDATVTLSGTYRCLPPSPSGAVQIGVTLYQDGTRLGLAGGDAVCDGEEHAWHASGSLRHTPDLHPGTAEAEARLSSVRPGRGLIPNVTPLSAHRQDVEILAAP